MTGLDPSLSRVEWDESTPLPVHYDTCEGCGAVVAWFAGYFVQAPKPARIVCVDCEREHGGEG
jgi:hypothetical protein